MVTKPEKWRRTSADFRGRGSEMANMDEETRNKFKRIKSILEEAKQKNRILILHNLEDSSDREKRRVLQETRYLYRENLILFSKRETRSDYLSHLVNEHPPPNVRSKKKEEVRLSIRRKSFFKDNSHQQYHNERSDNSISHQQYHRERSDNSISHQQYHRERSDNSIRHQQYHRERYNNSISHQQYHRERPDNSISHQQYHRERPDNSISHQQYHMERPDNSISHQQYHRERPDNSISHQQYHRERPDNSISHQQYHRERPDNSISHQQYHRERPDNSISHQQYPRERPDNSISHQQYPRERPDNSISHQQYHRERSDNSISHQQYHMERSDNSISHQQYHMERSDNSISHQQYHRERPDNGISHQQYHRERPDNSTGPTYGLPSQRQEMEGHRVGIFSRSPDSDYSWLVKMLRSKDCSLGVSSVHCCHISNDNMRKFIDDARDCTFGILYQTQRRERDNVTSIKYHLELETLGSILGKQKVMVLIDDVKDSSEHEKSRLLCTHHRAAQWFSTLLLVSDLDKKKKIQKEIKRQLQRQLQGSDCYIIDDVISVDLVKYEPRSRNTSSRRRPYGDESGYYTSQWREMEGHKVGIFSRSSEREFSWLVDSLRSEDFPHLVTSVTSFLITNNQTYQNFLDNIGECTFGIIYHTKNRGSVSVTNVTDSLYDQELETLNNLLGRQNVLVVIDDLEDSSDHRKMEILKDQPSIQEWATDLLLMSNTDKRDRGRMREKTNELKALLQCPGSLEDSRH
ncbi:uncharacterized protein [Engystomops pustulosus]|uniref:uncharacterized protein isoform X2 n=1 Tax=Engystomops pustulosus TaxID=76066 RepID=UPI003AFAB1AA